MAILNPEHLLEQAEKLVAPPAAGPPRQVDLRRAISSAYYGLFHFALTEVADEFVGATQRTSSRYTLVYRSIDHRALKELCNEVRKQTPPSKYAAYLPAGGFDQNVQIFAAAAVDLQEKRHNADYNPQQRYTTFDAKLAIETARNAVLSFQRANLELRKAFLTLLLCPPRA
jgi:uncharacterized protein (UPF0332 family)